MRTHSENTGHLIMPTARQITAFRGKILGVYRRHGRDLPFSRTTDPYRIAAPEIMLQQTQVERVVPKYHKWINKWPTWQHLAAAGERELLRMWSGLGYNRRALFLGRIARVVVDNFGGKLLVEPAVLANFRALASTPRGPRSSCPVNARASGTMP